MYEGLMYDVRRIYLKYQVPQLPIIKIPTCTAGLPATYETGTRNIPDDSTPKIASFYPSKVYDY